MQPCPIDRLRDPGSISALTRVFDALWAGTTELGADTASISD
jgi:hypothetical protein